MKMQVNIYGRLSENFLSIQKCNEAE
jgi:hypothetical protein